MPRAHTRKAFMALQKNCKFEEFFVQNILNEFQLIDENKDFKDPYRVLIEEFESLKKELQLEERHNKSSYNAPLHSKKKNVKTPQQVIDEKYAHLCHKYAIKILDLIKNTVPGLDNAFYLNVQKAIRLTENAETSDKFYNGNTEAFTLQFAIDVINKLCKGFAIFRRKDTKEINLIINNKQEAVTTFDNLTDLSGRNGFIFTPFNKVTSKNLFYEISDNLIVGERRIIDFAINLIVDIYSRILLRATLFCGRDIDIVIKSLLYMYYLQKNHPANFRSRYFIKQYYYDFLAYFPNYFQDGADFVDEKKSKETYAHAFKRSIEFLSHIENIKLVLSRRIDVENNKTIGQLYTKCLKKYPLAFVYMVKHNNNTIWLGASPEILAIRNRDTFVTMSLAGTMPYVEGEKIEWSPKNIREQKIVTDYIEETIKCYTNEYTIGKLRSAKAGPVVHLKTDFRAVVPNPTHALKLASELNPTPAVCGLPKENARNFLLNNEGYNREYYSGIVGFTQNDDFSFYVNLRCMRIIGDVASIYVGGGVLYESTLEEEWNETCQKMRTMQSLLSDDDEEDKDNN